VGGGGGGGGGRGGGFSGSGVRGRGGGVGRVPLAIARRPSDESDIYALINNPTAATEAPLSSGLFKTRSNGLGWTHVMLRQIKPIPGRLHNYVDLDLFGNVLAGNSDAERFREQDTVKPLLVDPSDPNVVYIG